jgi:hypothetical protein
VYLESKKHEFSDIVSLEEQLKAALQTVEEQEETIKQASGM